MKGSKRGLCMWLCDPPLTSDMAWKHSRYHNPNLYSHILKSFILPCFKEFYFAMSGNEKLTNQIAAITYLTLACDPSSIYLHTPGKILIYSECDTKAPRHQPWRHETMPDMASRIRAVKARSHVWHRLLSPWLASKS